MTSRLAALAVFAALVGCLPELVLAPCYSDADCASGSVCQGAACVVAPTIASCAVEPATRVRTIAFPYTGDRVPPAALAFDGARYWAVVEEVVPGEPPTFELRTVRLSPLGERVSNQDDDAVIRTSTTGQAVGPFLERGPRGLIAGWNETPTVVDPSYVGYVGPLEADGVVRAPVAFAGRLEELDVVGDAVYGMVRFDAEGVSALQHLGTTTVARFDPALFAASASRGPGGGWLVAAERGDNIDFLRLSDTFVVLQSIELLSGADGEAYAPLTRWTGDALIVLFAKNTAAGRVVRVLETDTDGAITRPIETLTSTIVGLPAMTYSRARDELAVVYARGTAVELVRISRRTGARVVHALSTPGVTAIEPTIVDVGLEYAAAWLEEAGTDGYLLRMSRVVCR